MEKKFRKSLFLFRRDLRLEDNTGVMFALKSSEIVIPAFIFTPEQIEKNRFKSDHYSIFTPYFRNASKQKVLPPVQTKGTNYFRLLYSSMMKPKKQLMPLTLNKISLQFRTVVNPVV